MNPIRTSLITVLLVPFGVHAAKLQNGTTPEVTLSVLYLDKGDYRVSLIYDSGDDVVRVRVRAPGAFKPGDEFQIDNSGTSKRHDVQLPVPASQRTFFWKAPTSGSSPTRTPTS